MIIIFLFLICDVTALVNPQGPTIINDFTNCLSALIKLNFHEPGLLIFGNTNNMSSSVARIRESLLTKIHETTNYSVEIMHPIDEAPICEHVEDNDADLNVVHMDQYTAIPLGDYFVLVIDKYEDFTQIASKFIRSRNWNPHAKFIVLFYHSNRVTESGNIRNVERVITCLFKHNVFKVLVAVVDAGNIRNAIVYSWRPFDPPNYCGYFNETARNRLVVVNICEQGGVKYRKYNFQDRLPHDMSGCVLNILALDRQPFIGDDPNDPNIEQKFIDEVAKLYNFETYYEHIHGFRGERNETTGVWDGALKKIVAKEGQLLLGGIFPDFDVHEDFESSTTYLADSYTWVVPRAEESPAWVSLIICFKKYVWYSVIVTYFICAISWKVIGHISEDTLYHKTLKHTFLNTLVCHLGFCSYVRPVKESLRVFYVFFNLYCILFLTGYQTKLFDVLTNPTFGEQIDTLEELVDSGLKYGGIEELHGLLENSTDPFDFFIGEHWEDVDNLTQALLDVVIHRNFSLLCSRLELAHMSGVMPELSDSLGSYKYYAFKQNMFTVPMEMVGLRGFAFMHDFSISMEILKQLGTNAKLRDRFATQNARKMASMQRFLSSEDPEVAALSMSHLQGGFLALFMGYLGGFLTLCLEIILNNNWVVNRAQLWKARLRKYNCLTTIM